MYNWIMTTMCEQSGFSKLGCMCGWRSEWVESNLCGIEEEWLCLKKWA